MIKILVLVSFVLGLSSPLISQVDEGNRKRKADEKFITTDKIMFYLEEGAVQEEYYRSLFQKTEGDAYRKFTNYEVFEGAADGLDDYLTTMLIELNYIDTSGRFFPDYKNSLHLDMTVSKIKLAHIRANKNSAIKKSFLEINASLRLMSYYGKEIVSKEITLERELKEASADSSISSIELLIKDIFETFLFDPEVQTLTESGKYFDLSEESKYFPMSIPFVPASRNIEQWQESVVTVITNEGHGSACVISQDGYLLTNFHVVGQNDTVRVKFMDNSNATAVVLRRHPDCDLALIKVDRVGLEFLTPSSKSYDMGEMVYVVGTPVDTTLSQSVSRGILSGYREFDNSGYLQTDAKVNPGNSGGALINESGELIGIVSAKFSGFGIEGIGFAVPISKLEEDLHVSSLKTNPAPDGTSAPSPPKTKKK